MNIIVDINGQLLCGFIIRPSVAKAVLKTVLVLIKSLSVIFLLNHLNAPLSKRVNQGG